MQWLTGFEKSESLPAKQRPEKLIVKRKDIPMEQEPSHIDIARELMEFLNDLENFE